MGDGGKIIKTIDGGSTWTFLTSNTFEMLYSVLFTNSTTGFITGSRQYILKTTDSGSTWSFSYGGNEGYLRSIYFVDSDTGYACGGTPSDSGIVVKTTDAGNSWRNILNVAHTTIESVYFTNSKIGYVVGDNGLIMKTINGGGDITGIVPIQSTELNKVTCFPNPVKATLYLNYSSFIQSVSIYDFQGKLLINENVIDNKVDVNNLPIGLYIIKFKLKDKVLCNKFIKE